MSLLLIMTHAACSTSDQTPCTTTLDCTRAEICSLGRCVPAQDDAQDARRGEDAAQNEGSDTDRRDAATQHTGDTAQTTPDDAPDMSIEQWDAGEPYRPATGTPDMDAQSFVDEGSADGECAGRAPRPGDLVINEALVNVPTGDEGDANGDGARDAYADEFVEVVSRADEALDLSGVRLLNGERVKVILPTLCLPPGQALVIFGGPRDLAAYTRPDGVRVMAADTRFGFSNRAGAIALRDEHQRTLFSMTYDDAPATSYVLDPELTGTAYIAHTSTPNARLFSPGTCADGSPIAAGCPIPSPDDERAGAPDMAPDMAPDAPDMP